MKHLHIFVISICYLLVTPVKAQSDSLGEFLDSAWVCELGGNVTPSISIEPGSAYLKLPLYISGIRTLHVRLDGVDFTTIGVIVSDTLLVELQGTPTGGPSDHVISAQLYDGITPTTPEVSVDNVEIWRGGLDSISVTIDTLTDHSVTATFLVDPYGMALGDYGDAGCFEHRVFLTPGIITLGGDTVPIGEVHVPANTTSPPYTFSYVHLGPDPLVEGCLGAWLTRRDTGMVPMFEDTPYEPTIPFVPICGISFPGISTGVSTVSDMVAIGQNPVSESFNIKTLRTLNYVVLDITGRVIGSGGKLMEGTHSIDASHWKSGSYLLVTTDGSTRQVLHLVRE